MSLLTYQELTNNINILEKIDQSLPLDQQSLNLVEEEFAIHVNSAEDAILIIQDSKIQFFNDRVYEKSGYTEKDLLGSDFISIVHPEDREIVIANHQKRFQNENVPLYSCRFVKKNKQVIWIEVRGLTVHWKGRPAALVLLRDVTEDVILLEERDERIRDLRLLERSAFGFVEMHPDDDIYQYIADRFRELANRAFIVLTSHNPETGHFQIERFSTVMDSISKTVNLLFGNKFQGLNLTLNDDVVYNVKRGELFELDNDFHRLTSGAISKSLSKTIGTTFAFDKVFGIGLVSNKIMYGAVAIIMRTGQEIKHRDLIEPFARQASIALQKNLIESDLRQSELKYKAVVEDQTESILRFCPDGNISFANAAYCRSAGLDLEAVMGSNLFNSLDNSQKSELNQKLESLSPGQPVTEYQFHLEEKNRSKKYFEWTIRALFDNKKNLIEYQSVGRDITSRKKSEEDLKSAILKAEESDRLKTSFLANMSHEIRTPMNSITGFTDFLLKEDVSGEDKEMFGKYIKGGTERLRILLDDILDIAMIESNQLKIKKVKCDIDKILSELHLVFSHKYSEKIISGINFLIEAGRLPDSAWIVTDPGRLKQILTNLIDNAFKFTETGSITVGYTTDIYSETTHKGLVFYVKDTGPGIPLHHQELIFERFTKSNLSNTKIYEGPGLGLTIADSLSRMLGGRLWMESKPDQGSTFYFEIPMTKPDRDKDKRKKTGRKGLQKLRDKHFLIVEDDEGSYLLLKSILQDYNTQLTWVKNAEECYNAVEKQVAFDLILMDIRLPGIDGYEISREIRNKGLKIPIIAQTAYAMPDDKLKCREAGCDDFITKPIKEEELLSMLTAHI